MEDPAIKKAIDFERKFFADPQNRSLYNQLEIQDLDYNSDLRAAKEEGIVYGRDLESVDSIKNIMKNQA